MNAIKQGLTLAQDIVENKKTPPVVLQKMQQINLLDKLKDLESKLQESKEIGELKMDSKKTITEELRKEINEFYQTCYKKEYDAATDRVLKNVRVYPGQDPYMAGHSALLEQEDKIASSAKDNAEKQTISKYKITKQELHSIVK